MKDYSAMSDFEINKAVAIACGYAEENCDYGWSGKPDVGVEWNEDTGYPTKSFNYCNSWADAGPIIQKYKIAINPVGDYWQAGKGMHEPLVSDKNPLRAAMIVFLMMQEIK